MEMLFGRSRMVPLLVLGTPPSVLQLKKATTQSAATTSSSSTQLQAQQAVESKGDETDVTPDATATGPVPERRRQRDWSRSMRQQQQQQQHQATVGMFSEFLQSIAEAATSNTSTVDVGTDPAVASLSGEDLSANQVALQRGPCIRGRGRTPQQ
ncbi:UNVERIFIED_CONTAM: hypothetical protein FKN15_065459 [Acipenser sinensis]